MDTAEAHREDPVFRNVIGIVTPWHPQEYWNPENDKHPFTLLCAQLVDYFHQQRVTELKELYETNLAMRAIVYRCMLPVPVDDMNDFPNMEPLQLFLANACPTIQMDCAYLSDPWCKRILDSLVNADSFLSSSNQDVIAWVTYVVSHVNWNIGQYASQVHKLLDQHQDWNHPLHKVLRDHVPVDTLKNSGLSFFFMELRRIMQYQLYDAEEIQKSWQIDGTVSLYEHFKRPALAAINGQSVPFPGFDFHRFTHHMEIEKVTPCDLQKASKGTASVCIDRNTNPPVLLKYSSQGHTNSNDEMIREFLTGLTVNQIRPYYPVLMDTLGLYRATTGHRIPDVDDEARQMGGFVLGVGLVEHAIPLFQWIGDQSERCGIHPFNNHKDRKKRLDKLLEEFKDDRAKAYQKLINEEALSMSPSGTIFKYEILCTMYLLYWCMDQMKDHFMHADLHLANVMVVPFPEGHAIHVNMVMDDDGTPFTFPVRAWPIIIDFGQARVNPDGLLAAKSNDPPLHSSEFLYALYGKGRESKSFLPNPAHSTLLSLFKFGHLKMQPQHPVNDDVDSVMFTTAFDVLLPPISSRTHPPLLRMAPGQQQQLQTRRASSLKKVAQLTLNGGSSSPVQTVHSDSAQQVTVPPSPDQPVQQHKSPQQVTDLGGAPIDFDKTLAQALAQAKSLCLSLAERFPRGLANDQPVEPFQLTLDTIDDCLDWLNNRMLMFLLNLISTHQQRIRKWFSPLMETQYITLLYELVTLNQSFPTSIQVNIGTDYFDGSMLQSRALELVRAAAGRPIEVTTTPSVFAHQTYLPLFDGMVGVKQFLERCSQGTFPHKCFHLVGLDFLSYDSQNQWMDMLEKTDEFHNSIVIVQLKSSHDVTDFRRHFFQEYCSSNEREYVFTMGRAIDVMSLHEIEVLPVKYDMLVMYTTTGQVHQMHSELTAFMRQYVHSDYPDLELDERSFDEEIEISAELIDRLQWLQPLPKAMLSVPLGVSLKEAMFAFYRKSKDVFIQRGESKCVGTLVIREKEGFEWQPVPDEKDGYFDHFREFLSSCLRKESVDESRWIRADTVVTHLGTSSFNGMVSRLQNGHDEPFIAKRVQSRSSDNPVYEYFTGLAVNKLRREWPCFVETYDLYRMKDTSDLSWTDVERIDEPDAALATSVDPKRFVVTTQFLKQRSDQNRNMMELREFLTHAQFDNKREEDTESDAIMQYISNTILLHSCLTSLADRFRHQDQHDGNVMLLPVHSRHDRYISVHLPGLEIPLYINLWPVFIDFGRSYVYPTTSPLSQQVLATVDAAPCRSDHCTNWGFRAILQDRSTQLYPQVYRYLDDLVLRRLPPISYRMWDQVLVQFLWLYRRIPERNTVDTANFATHDDETCLSLQQVRNTKNTHG